MYITVPAVEFHFPGLNSGSVYKNSNLLLLKAAQWNWNQGSHFLVEAGRGLASTKSIVAVEDPSRGAKSLILGLEQWAIWD